MHGLPIIEEKFIVCHIREDIILGMPFLVQGRTSMELACTRQTEVQVICATTIPPREEVLLKCQFTVLKFSSQRLIEDLAKTE